MVERRRLGSTYLVLLAPNCSMSWPGVMRFWLLVCAVSLGIGTLFAIRGLWPVLPLAGLELLALGSALYVVQHRARVRELVKVGPEEVAVERGRERPECRWVFPRAWVRVTLREPPYRGHPSELVLRSHGREVAIGRFLVEEERAAVASELRDVLHRERPWLPDESSPQRNFKASGD